MSSSGGRSINSIWSARSSAASGTVSCTRMPVICATASFRLSICWMLSVVTTSMPAPSTSITSCQRLGWRDPGALVCANSSMSARRGFRASRSVEIHLLDHLPAILDRATRQLFERSKQGGRFPHGHAFPPVPPPHPRRRAPAPALPPAWRRSCPRRGRRQGRSSAAPHARLPPRHVLHRGSFPAGAVRVECRHQGLTLARQSVEGEIERQHIHARLTKDAKLTSLDLPFDERADLRFRPAARLGDPRDLHKAPAARYPGSSPEAEAVTRSAGCGPSPSAFARASTHLPAPCWKDRDWNRWSWPRYRAHRPFSSYPRGQPRSWPRDGRGNSDLP